MRTLPNMTLDEIVEETSQWPADAVADLVDRIMLARHGSIPPEIDAAWRDEVRRRIDDVDRGRVQGIPLEETLAKARQILGR